MPTRSVALGQSQQSPVCPAAAAAAAAAIYAAASVGIVDAAFVGYQAQWCVTNRSHKLVRAIRMERGQGWRMRSKCCHNNSQFFTVKCQAKAKRMPTKCCAQLSVTKRRIKSNGTQAQKNLTKIRANAAYA